MDKETTKKITITIDLLPRYNNFAELQIADIRRTKNKTDDKIPVSERISK